MSFTGLLCCCVWQTVFRSSHSHSHTIKWDWILDERSDYNIHQHDYFAIRVFLLCVFVHVYFSPCFTTRIIRTKYYLGVWAQRDRRAYVSKSVSYGFISELEKIMCFSSCFVYLKIWFLFESSLDYVYSGTIVQFDSRKKQILFQIQKFYFG